MRVFERQSIDRRRNLPTLADRRDAIVSRRCCFVLMLRALNENQNQQVLQGKGGSVKNIYLSFFFYPRASQGFLCIFARTGQTGNSRKFPDHSRWHHLSGVCPSCAPPIRCSAAEPEREGALRRGGLSKPRHGGRFARARSRWERSVLQRAHRRGYCESAAGHGRCADSG